MPAQRKTTRKIIINVPERVDNVKQVITSRSDQKTGRILEYLVETDNDKKIWAKPSAIADSEAFKLYKTTCKNDIEKNIWPVEDILKKRRNKMGEMEFLARWAGWPRKAANWEPKASFHAPFDEEKIPWVKGQQA